MFELDLKRIGEDVLDRIAEQMVKQCIHEMFGRRDPTTEMRRIVEAKARDIADSDETKALIRETLHSWLKTQASEPDE